MKLDTDRLVLHTIHGDAGYTEVFYGRAADDWTAEPEGSLQFLKGGGFCFKAQTDEEVAYVVSVKANRTLIMVGEDMYSVDEIDADPDLTPAFDSADLKWGDPRALIAI